MQRKRTNTVRRCERRWSWAPDLPAGKGLKPLKWALRQPKRKNSRRSSPRNKKNPVYRLRGHGKDQHRNGPSPAVTELEDKENHPSGCRGGTPCHRRGEEHQPGCGFFHSNSQDPKAQEPSLPSCVEKGKPRALPPGRLRHFADSMERVRENGAHKPFWK